jgi:hypothetical protein
VPEEVDRARLAAVPAGELLEDLVRPVEDVPEAFDRVSLVGRVLAILGERRRHRQAEGRLADRDVDSEPVQLRVQLPVELGHGEPVVKLERVDVATVRRDRQPMIDEVEHDLEADPVRVHAARRQPPYVQVEGDVPPVVARSR